MQLANHESCTGCMACLCICPTKAIHQGIDAFGFVIPVIREELCIRCGLCEKVCPIMMKNPVRFPSESEISPKGICSVPAKDSKCDHSISVKKQDCITPILAWSVYHKDEEAVRKSSSGGAFYALASQVLQKDGIVYGSYYDVKKKKAYLTDTDHMPLEALLTSKYVESYAGLGYRRVKKQLEKGREVLFCSTPCQVAGLRSYLGKEYENLLLVDFVCGAVTANKYLRDYLRSLERRYSSKVIEMSFRDKYYGWGQYCFYAKFENGKIYRKTAMSDPYFFCFLRSSMQRLSCHGCRFSDHHVSDLCLSDFWKCDHFKGIDRNNRKGLSLVTAYTVKGVKATEKLKEVTVMQELDLNQASYNIAPRSLQISKLPEIYSHQEIAQAKGVAALRRKILPFRKRGYYAIRQFVMDHPLLKKHFPGLAGKGQIQ